MYYNIRQSSDFSIKMIFLCICAGNSLVRTVVSITFASVWLCCRSVSLRENIQRRKGKFSTHQYLLVKNFRRNRKIVQRLKRKLGQYFLVYQSLRNEPTPMGHGPRSSLITIRWNSHRDNAEEFQIDEMGIISTT